MWLWTSGFRSHAQLPRTSGVINELGNIAMTYKLVVAAVVGLCRHDVRIGDGFSWKWSNGNELWKLVVVRVLFARCGSFSCLVSTAAVGQQFVDREGGMFCVKKK